MKLTMMVVKNAKPKKKAYKLFDDAGLYLLVSTTGRKYWRYDYCHLGKCKAMSLGVYPDVTLKNAREECRELRLMMEGGLDPKIKQAENSFKAVAIEWLERQKVIWTESHCRFVDNRLKNDVFPFLGDRPIVEIKATEVLAMLRRIEQRKAYETAYRVGLVCSKVLQYAIVTGRAECNVVADLKGY